MNPEQRHMEAVAGLGCIMALLGWGAECGGLRACELHHPREDEGGAQRAPDMLVVPLCTAHHTGPLGIHHARAFRTRTKLTVWDLLAETLRRLEVRRHRSKNVG